MTKFANLLKQKDLKVIIKVKLYELLGTLVSIDNVNIYCS